MVNPIPESVRKIWDEWNIRGVIFLSLSLQLTLFLLASLRKGTANKLIIMLIWSVYLLADWSAIFALGLISNSQGDTPDSSLPAAENTDDLLALWTPFLFLHLGGPDNITAFALEDNELWFRHLVGLLIQSVAALYIFVLSLSKSSLAIPTLLLFVAGSIKYLERTRAFYLASFDGFQDSAFKESLSLSEDGYNKKSLEEDDLASFDGFQDSAFKESLSLSENDNKKSLEEDEFKQKAKIRENRDAMQDLEVMQYAYYYFRIFKGIVTDLILEVYQHQMSRAFFECLRPADALRVIEVELNLIYEVFYTKVQVVYSLAGFVCRFIFLGLVVAAFSVFHFQVKKHGFDEFDVAITYALFSVAIALDTMALFILFTYDITIGSLMNPDDVSPFLSRMKFRIAAMLNWVLNFKKSRWYPCHNHSDELKHEVLFTPFLFGRWSGYVSGFNLLRYCQKERPIRAHKVRNCLCPHFEKVIQILAIAINKVSLFLNRIIFTRILDSVIQLFGFIIGKVVGLLGLSNFIDEIRYVSHEPLSKELWEFICYELRERSHAAQDSGDAVKIASARGAWILKGKYYSGVLMPYLTEVTFDESILLWHIATELLYQTDQGNTTYHREFSKMLSDYMLYLLVFNSTMMSTIVGLAKIRFQDTCAEILDYFESRGLESIEEENAFQVLLSVRTFVIPETKRTTGAGYSSKKSVLFDAIILAKQLRKLDDVFHVPEVEMDYKWELIRQLWAGDERLKDKFELKREILAKLKDKDKVESIREMLAELEDKDKWELLRQMWAGDERSEDKVELLREMLAEGEEKDKWELISKVWVELLLYAACYSTPRTHIQQVSQGGELITFVWFLMAHFGLRQQFHNTIKQQLNRGLLATDSIIQAKERLYGVEIL